MLRALAAHILRILPGIGLALVFAACAPSPETKKNPDSQYRFEKTECDTGEQEAKTYAEFCKKISDNDLDGGQCGMETRKLSWAYYCGLAYEYTGSTNGQRCTTGAQRYKTPETFCAGLLNDAQNNNCARDERLTAFQNICQKEKWNYRVVEKSCDFDPKKFASHAQFCSALNNEQRIGSCDPARAKELYIKNCLTPAKAAPKTPVQDPKAPPVIEEPAKIEEPKIPTSPVPPPMVYEPVPPKVPESPVDPVPQPEPKEPPKNPTTPTPTPPTPGPTAPSPATPTPKTPTPAPTEPVPGANKLPVEYVTLKFNETVKSQVLLTEYSNKPQLKKMSFGCYKNFETGITHKDQIAMVAGSRVVVVRNREAKSLSLLQITCEGDFKLENLKLPLLGVPSTYREWEPKMFGEFASPGIKMYMSCEQDLSKAAFSGRNGVIILKDSALLYWLDQGQTLLNPYATITCRK